MAFVSLPNSVFLRHMEDLANQIGFERQNARMQQVREWQQQDAMQQEFAKQSDQERIRQEKEEDENKQMAQQFGTAEGTAGLPPNRQMSTGPEQTRYWFGHMLANANLSEEKRKQTAAQAIAQLKGTGAMDRVKAREQGGMDIEKSREQSAAQIEAEREAAAEQRGKDRNDTLRYAADKRMSAMLQRPRLNSFWQEKKYWDTGQGGTAISNLNTATQHMERLRGAISNLKNQGAIHFNQLKNAYEYETGDPRILDYKTISHVETREIAKFLNASGVLTDEEKASTNALVNQDLPMEGQETVLRDLWNMATDKHESLMHQRNHMFEDPDQYESWSPGAVNAAGRMGVSVDNTQGNGPQKGGGGITSPTRVPSSAPSNADPHAGMPSQTIDGETRYWNGSAWVQ